MKLFTVKKEEKEFVALLNKDEQTLIPIAALGLPYKDMNQLIAEITQEELFLLKEAVLNGSFNNEETSKNLLLLSDVIVCAPIPKPNQDVICLGINYMAHAAESARYKAEAFGGERPYPIYFSKRVNKAVGTGGVITSHSDIVDSLDYEAELTVVIGKDAFQIKKEDAYDYVFGYTIINDVSARNLQTQHKQWYFGKSLDGFLPMGPCITTSDEISSPPNLKICSRVNGELRQNSSTSLLIFDIAHVIHELSQGMTLKAGTLIAMGTPAGVGMGFQPPKWLKSGDTVECEIEKIGILKNTVK
ncbi:fumarylacetoacetate hydrolase family protein [Anaerovorax sp. IOR16]|uniref:fumarylacetoacetate hydrolase family protein n=1 Tax=Anaerovorax sp. IOR16 TaxID=2773458 RepID=UPI0019CFFEF4|nr:fumarylacetoacetate hydrolase family protein [Anaerovorax sp. IOR16]